MHVSPLLPPPTQTSSPAGSHLFLRPGLRVVLLTCRRRPVVFLQFAGMKRSSRLWARVHKELNATRVPGSLSTHTKYLIPPLLPLLTHPPSDSFFFVLYSFLSCPPSFFPPYLVSTILSSFPLSIFPLLFFSFYFLPCFCIFYSLFPPFISARSLQKLETCTRHPRLYCEDADRREMPGNEGERCNLRLFSWWIDYCLVYKMSKLWEMLTIIV